MTAFIPLDLQLRSRLSDIDAPTPPTPPSPVLSASQSCTSGEIPILLVPSISVNTPAQLTIAGSTSSLPQSAWSVGTFGQTVQQSAPIVSHLSHDSLRDGEGFQSSNSNFSTTATVFTSTPGYRMRSVYGVEQSALRLSAYLLSTSSRGYARADNCAVDSCSFVKPTSELISGSSTVLLGSPREHEQCKILNDSVGSQILNLQPHREANVSDHRERSEPDVPLSLASTFLLSPVASIVPELTNDSANHIHQQRHLRTASAPIIDAYESFNRHAPQNLSPSSSTRPRSNSNPHLPFNGPSPSHLATSGVPNWLHGMGVELWIDQEGFRAIQPHLELMSFSRGVGTNQAGESLDVAEFVMRTTQTWHFHYAPLDRAPVLRRLTVNGDMNDYISRQAALTIKNNGVYAVESTEHKGRVAWKFEYHVEDRHAPGSGRIIRGEKRFTPLRFVCNPTLLTAEHGKKIKLLQFMRKSVIPKLQSVRLRSDAGAGAVLPRNRIREDKNGGALEL